MSDSLRFSVFNEVFFPSDISTESDAEQHLQLQKVIRFQPNPNLLRDHLSMVVFDFETTGLDSDSDQIIEIGAIKLNGNVEGEQFSVLIDPGMELSEEVCNITGITNDMLKGQPKISDVLDDFLEFIKGSVLVAHNAEFDMAFLRNACRRQGVQLQWPSFCTLKMARQLLPELGSKNLDSLAEHYGLTFEARHRSIGDCKVTGAVLHEMLDENSEDFLTWQDLQEFYVTKS